MPRVVLNDRVLIGLKAEKQTFFWDRSLPSFGVRANPGGKRTFILFTGKPRRLYTIGHYPSTSLAMARKEAHKLLEDTNSSTISFDAARALFFVKHLDTLKATTAHEQKNLMRRFPFQKPLAFVTLKDIERVLEDMPRGSARSCFNVLRTFFRWCVANDYLEKSPLKYSPYKPRHRERLLTDDEIRLIWCESFDHGSFGAIVRLLLLTGQRLNQIASLEPGWVQAQGTLFVFPASAMKSNIQHSVPLEPLARKQLPDPLPSPYVFPTLTSEKPFNNFSDAMTDFRAKLPDIPHFTLHDFRRYFSSTCAKLRIPIDVTEAIMDHRSGSRSEVQRIYDRYDRLPEMRSALERYENHVFSVVERT